MDQRFINGQEMGELKKKWFQTVWALMTLASVVITWLQRGSDAAWVHSAGMETLGKVLLWILLPMTVVMFVMHCVENLHTGERYFWRKWLRWGEAATAGIVLAVVLVLVIRYLRGDSLMMEHSKQVTLFIIFATAGLVWGVAKYMFNRSRKR